MKRIGMLNIKVKKRTHETPKEINQYLKDNKKTTIREIAERLNLPKTQVEHYFRTDNSRAIPSPQIWIRLKEVMGLDDRWDRQVTEFYEKEMEYEMTRRIYDSTGDCPTLKAGENTPIISDTSTSSEESGGSASDSKEPIIMGTLTEALGTRQGSSKEFISSVMKIKEALDVSDTTNSTNTQSRPTTRTSGQPTSRQTSLSSKSKKSPLTTLSVRDSLAKLSALLEKGEVSRIRGVLSSLKSAGLLNITDQNIYSLKTLRVCSPTKKGRHSKQSFKRWMNWGIASNGRCLTARISAFPKTGKGCSLSDILEENVEDKYFLSQKAINLILSRDSNYQNKLATPSGETIPLDTQTKHTHTVLMPTTIKEKDDPKNTEEQ